MGGYCHNCGGDGHLPLETACGGSGKDPRPLTRRMVERRDRAGYRRVPEREYERRAPGLRLEGADGDEASNTVTYWYTAPPAE